MKQELTLLDFEVDNLVVEVKEAQNQATDIHREAYWYNKKTQIIFTGALIALIGLFALWIINLSH